jgi:hypothetical protein
MSINSKFPRPHQPFLSQVLRVREDIERFEDRFPPLANGEPFPALTWEQLARHLKHLAPTARQAEIAEELLLRTKALAPFKPAEMVVREVLCIAAIVLDEGAAASASARARQ